MGKRWVVPDIHGCANTLQALLDHHILPARGDELFFLGDYIDRGPDSKGVLDILIDLEVKGFTVKALLGNHEESLITSWLEDREPLKKSSLFSFRKKNRSQQAWKMFGGSNTLDSFGVKTAGDIPEVYVNWLKERSYYYETDGFLLVHAGFNFKKENIFEDEHAMLWIRDFQVDIKKTGGRKVVHGHVPVSLEFIDMAVQTPDFNFIDLDNGVYMTDQSGYGNLLALELNSFSYVAQNNLDMN